MADVTLSPQARHALVETERLYGLLSDRRPEIAKLDDAFGGSQPLAYASDEWRKFHQDRYSGFADNWCEVVARAAPERTELFGIRVGDDAKVQSAEERSLWRDWVVNDGTAKASMGYLSGAVAKRSFAMVWGDHDGEPTLSFEHASQAIVDHSPMGEPRNQLKAWLDGNTEFAYLYTPTTVWKWRRDAPTAIGARPSGLYVPPSTMTRGSWQPHDTDDDGVWPIRNPLGLGPLVELPNRPLLGSGPISDISGTLAMQHAINLMWAYLFTAADAASMPARVVMGQEPPKIPILDNQGQKIGERAVSKDDLTKGRLLWLTGQHTSIGQWDAARLDVFTDVLNVMVKHLASQTRTPIHYIMGELGNVNGETLTATELPLAYKVRDGIKHLVRPHREIFRRFALVRGDRNLADACRTARLQWANPETTTDSQMSDAALKDIQVGWSFASVLERRYGLSQPEIADELRRRESELSEGLLLKPEIPDAADSGDQVPAPTAG